MINSASLSRGQVLALLAFLLGFFAALATNAADSSDKNPAQSIVSANGNEECAAKKRPAPAHRKGIISGQKSKKRFKKVKGIILEAQEINSLSEINVDELAGKAGVTIVFWDLDGTLVSPLHPFFESAWEEQLQFIGNFHQTERLKCTHPEIIAFVKYFESIQNIDPSCKARDEKLVEGAKTISFLQGLDNKKNVIHVGLTARHLNLSEWTKTMLSKNGINFAKLSGLGDSTLDTSSLDLSASAGFSEGIYYTGRTQKKVYVIPPLIDLITKRLGKKGPVTGVLIEDNAEEIEEFEKASKNGTNIPENLILKPYFYRAHDIYLDTLSLEVLFDDLKDNFFDPWFAEIENQIGELLYQ